MAIVVLDSGTEILCPSCKTVMVVARRNVFKGRVLKSEDFEPVRATPKDGELMECPDCKVAYGAMKLYTKDGWV